MDGAPCNEGAILGLLAQREQARKVRDYQTADRIREDLRNVHNVRTQDDDKVWSVMGGAMGGAGLKTGP